LIAAAAEPLAISWASTHLVFLVLVAGSRVSA
jgi:hypothetical protein